MMNQAPQPNLSNEQQLLLTMFKKFCADAFNMLGANPSFEALFARSKLKEAEFWGDMAISTMQVQAVAPVQPPSPESSSAPVDAAPQEVAGSEVPPAQ
jgi:hypothetical protein